ncbi:MAG: DUF58 domain-containing protein [Myxococcota bacterium]
MRRRRLGRSFRFTREGKVFIAVTAGVGIAAINTGNNLLYLVLGLLLSLLLVSGTLSDLALYKLTLRRYAPQRLVVGLPSLFEIEVKNRKGRVPSYALEIEDLAKDETIAERRCFFLKVAPKKSQVASYERVPKRRGPLQMERVVARTRYPFGLIEKGQRYRLEDELIVLPAPLPVPTPPLHGAHRGDDEAAKVRGRGTEVLGLREYRTGDDARSVHWRRSANLDRVVVRERAKAAQGVLVLRVDNAFRAAGARRDAAEALEGWNEAFERRISAAAYLVEWALRQGMGVQVLLRGESSTVAGPGQGDALLRFLALADATEQTDPFDEVAPHATVWDVRAP